MTSSSALSAAAGTLRDLHRPGAPLVLPNAWDAGSARQVVAAGFPVVATTSSGVAESIGYADHQQTPPEQMFAAIGRIARAVAVPVTADVEAGYGLEPDALVDALLSAGAVGLNLEDGDHAVPGRLLDAEQQAERLAGVKRAARAAGVDVVLNARVDVFLRMRDAEPAEQVAEAVRRARMYRAAGADCVFPIMVRGDDEAIGAVVREVVREVDAPVNVLLRDEPGGVARMAALGVARISLGGGLHAAAVAATGEVLRRLGEAAVRR